MRALTSALVGHLYELTQHYPVTLLTEPLPPRYHELLQRRDLFPLLERIEVIRGLGFGVSEMLSNNRRWQRLAEHALDAFAPDVVVTENDMSSLFDMYLLQAAKRRNIRRLTIQGMGQCRDMDNRRFVELLHVYRGGVTPPLPLAWWRRQRSRARKKLGHALVHYLLPWAAGQRALRGKSSYVTLAGAPGMRDSELHLVQSTPQYQVFLDSGVQAHRLAILEHPLARVPAHVFFPVPPVTAPQTGKRMLILMAASRFGFARASGALISADHRRALRLAIIAEIRRVLPTWELLIKAHPDFGTLDTARTYLGEFASPEEVVDPREPVEPLLPHADAVVDLPAPWTSTLVTATNALPDKPVIAADLDGDFMGDIYRGWPGIEYVNSMEALSDVLKLLHDGRYRRRDQPTELSQAVRHFRTTGEAVDALLQGTSS